MGSATSRFQRCKSFPVAYLAHVFALKKRAEALMVGVALKPSAKFTAPLEFCLAIKQSEFSTVRRHSYYFAPIRGFA